MSAPSYKEIKHEAKFYVKTIALYRLDSDDDEFVDRMILYLAVGFSINVPRLNRLRAIYRKCTNNGTPYERSL